VRSNGRAPSSTIGQYLLGVSDAARMGALGFRTEDGGLIVER
jgi:hypothetical protein